MGEKVFPKYPKGVRETDVREENGFVLPESFVTFVLERSVFRSRDSRSNMESQLIKNCRVFSLTEQKGVTIDYKNGAVGIVGNRIAFVGDDPNAIARFEQEHGAELRVVDARGMLLLPGLINLHNHVAMTLMRGYANDMELQSWLTEKIWPFEAKLTPEDVRRGAALGVAEMVLGGTTTFADMYWHTDQIIEQAIQSGVRMVACPAFTESVFEGYLDQVGRMIERYHGAAAGRIAVWVAPHAPYTCRPEQIRDSLSLCRKYGVGVHIHLSETASEVEIVRERYGQTPIRLMQELGVFEYPTLAAHCVYQTDEEIEILRNDQVTVVYNPQSNMKLASGVAPISRMLEKDINVCIGTDGPSSNNDLDMWDEMRTGALLQKVATGDPRALPAEAVFRMATVDAAKAIGHAGELGIVAEGALADLILVDLDQPHYTPDYDLIGNLVYCGRASDVDTVWIDGRLVVRSRQLMTLDFETIKREVRQTLQKFE